MTALGGAIGRIIPARAGFTRSSLRCWCSCPDHPRSRGVYKIVIKNAINKGGSSPLARGLRIPRHVGARPPRIIPARAGFTAASKAHSPTSWDHPRSRGVYVVLTSADMMRAGSSPLARGLPELSTRRRKRRRIIPARAGFTKGPGPRIHPRWDHPRSRGVYPSNA